MSHSERQTRWIEMDKRGRGLDMLDCDGPMISNLHGSDRFHYCIGRLIHRAEIAGDLKEAMYWMWQEVRHLQRGD